MRYLWILILSLILVIGCSTETDNPNAPSQLQQNREATQDDSPNDSPEPIVYSAPSVPLLNEIPTPNSKKLNYGLIRTQVGIQAINFTTEQTRSYLNELRSVQPMTLNDTTFIRTVKIGDLNITFTAIVENGNHYDWYLALDGKGWFNTYQEWVLTNGECWKQEKEGYYNFYMTNTTNVAFGSKWGVKTNGENFCEWNDNLLNKTVYLAYSENGGSYKVTKDNVIRFESEWIADNTGWWKLYDSNGKLIDEGTW